MASRRYRFHLLVLKLSHSFASITRERYFHHSKIKLVSPRGHVVSSIYSSKNDIWLRYWIWRLVIAHKKRPTKESVRNFKFLWPNSKESSRPYLIIAGVFIEPTSPSAEGASSETQGLLVETVRYLPPKVHLKGIKAPGNLLLPN